MTRDGDRPAVSRPMPELADLLVVGETSGRLVNPPRFVLHEGRVYDLTRKFDQNCVKMHAQRILRKIRTQAAIEKKLQKPNRKQRRAAAAAGANDD